MISDAEVDQLHEAIRLLGYTTNRQSREIAELLATLNLAGVVGGDAVDAKGCYAMGWRRAALWADRDDLVCDIDSPAFERDMATDLAALAKGNDHVG